MDVRRVRGTGFAWLCIVLGTAVALYAALRLLRGEGGSLLIAIGLPALAYGVLMLRAVRRVGE